MKYDGMRNEKVSPNGRRGAVGIIFEAEQFLVIRRSRWVRAPGMWCFPGGGIEAGESIEHAVVREMQEELGIETLVERHLWTSRTSWGTDLEWVLLSRKNQLSLVPNPREVEAVRWLSEPEIVNMKPLLGSVLDFFDALSEGRFSVQNQDPSSKQYP